MMMSPQTMWLILYGGWLMPPPQRTVEELQQTVQEQGKKLDAIKEQCGKT